MAISKAIKFVKQATTESKFRTECNLYQSKDELFKAFDFNENDFENAINMQLVKCQTYERAEHFQQIRIWFHLL
jgi:hypothetical protein